MPRLSNRRFFQFTVTLVEAGDLPAMEAMLAEHPAHAHALLHETRVGAGDGRYSAMGYATWLCQFADYRDRAREVVRWLLERGHTPDLWTALALDDDRALAAVLAAAPGLATARHPVWSHTALQMASPRLRPQLLAHGADDGTVSTALLLGDTDRARAMIETDPALLHRRLAPDGGTVLTCALGHGRDAFACFLLEQGADPRGATGDGFPPLHMAANWGCPRAVTALLARGVDVNQRVEGFTPLSLVVSRGSGLGGAGQRAAMVRLLLDAGAKRTAPRVDGRSLMQWCDDRGLDDVRALLEGTDR